MTYETAAAQPARDPWAGVELALDKCSLAFGVGACGATGEPCYNTRATCKFLLAYALGDPLLVRSCTRRVEGWQESGQPAPEPTLISLDIAPTVLDPGRSLGLRASVMATIQDHPGDDYRLDPYMATRATIAAGTVWGRTVARNIHMIGRELRVSDGFLASGAEVVDADTRTRLYRIESIDGPDKSGVVNVSAKDPLRLADGLSAQVPLPSDGKLAADITDSATSATLEAGQGAAYAGVDWVRIGDEVCALTAVVGDTLTLTRATVPAWYEAASVVADAHSAGDTVQACVLFDTIRIDALIYDLLTTWAGVPASYITLADWSDFSDVYLSNHIFSCLLTKPTAVKDLLEELAQHLALVWWDDRAGKIRFDSIKGAPTAGVFSFNDDTILADTPTIKRDDRSRISQCWFFYGQRSPINDEKKPENFASVFANADLDAETAIEYGEARIKQVFSRWVKSSGLPLALELTGRMVEFWRDPAVIASFSVDASQGAINTGDTLDLTTRYLQGVDGMPLTTRMLVVSVSDSIEDGATTYTVSALKYSDTGRRQGLWTDDSTPLFAVATDQEKRDNGYWCDDDGLMPDGSAGYVYL